MTKPSDKISQLILKNTNKCDWSIKAIGAIMNFLDEQYEVQQKKEPCPNCEETVEECACLRNKCIKCGNPVGNITFTCCDDCWDKKEEKKERWKPKSGEIFFYILGNGTISKGIWADYGYDIDSFNAFNCFQTKEQAEECLRREIEVRKKYWEEINGLI